MGKWGRAVYRSLLLCYPRWFRHVYAAQMEADFSEVLSRCRGSRAMAGAWWLALRDIARSAPSVWTRPNNRRQASPNTREGRMTSVVQDFRTALRSLRRAPGFALVVVATLAVGIGGTVAMFSVADGVLFTDLPYRDADRLAVIWNRHVSTGADKVQISGPDLMDYRSQTSSFEDFAYVHNATDNTLTDGDRAEQVDVGYVSENFFSFLGIDAAVGRTFGVADGTGSIGMDAIGSAVINYGLWARRYGSDPAVIGKTIYLSGQPLQIVGVTPADFRLVLPYSEDGAMSAGANENVDVWRVLSDRSFPRMNRSMAVVRVVARLTPETNFEAAQQEMDAVAAGLRAGYRVHGERGTQIDVVRLQSDVVGHVRSIILSLFGGVAVVLLIACANVANLVSVQANNRSREVAVRMALGAHRRRILQQLFTEYAMLAGVGAMLGIMLAQVLTRAIVTMAPPSIPLIERVEIDLRALGFAIIVTTLATILFGLWPAMRVAKADPSTRLSAGARGAVGRGNTFRNGVVTAEIALSLVLLVCGGLLIRSFLQLQRATLGFEPASVVTAKIALGHGTYDDDELRRRYWSSLLVQLQNNPNVQSAGLVWPLPFTGQGAELPYNDTDGESSDWGRLLAFGASATPGYFTTMRADVIDGRVFELQDLERADEIAVVDDLVAQRLFPAGTAVGRTIWIDEMSGVRRALEIIGVVRHIRHSNVTGAEREVIYRWNPAARNLAVVARTEGGLASVGADLRRTTGALDRDTPLFDERMLSSYLTAEIAPTRFTMTMASVFGVVALLMAVVGLYGVVSYAVAQRTAELGVRMALGAGEGSIVRLVLRRGVLVIGVGITLGLFASFAVTGIIRSLLVEVAPRDPMTFAVTAALLAIAALVASYVPARRAGRLDPATTLRNE